MATTTLFVEILVIGAIAEIWIVLIVLAVASPNPTTVLLLIDSVGKLSALLVFPFLALTYALGWVVNFTAERLFKPVFQKKFRDQVFEISGIKYYEVRGLVYQKASKDVIEDLRFDRHILRISRSSVLNFLLIAVALSLHFYEHTSVVIVGIILSVTIAVLSLLQWVTRYKSSYSKIRDTYKVIKAEYDCDRCKSDEVKS